MVPNEESIWFYVLNHKQQGPVGLFELRKMFEQGILTGDTFIWSKEMDSWQTAKSLDLFPELNYKIAAEEPSPINFAGNWEEIKKDTYPAGRPFIRFLARLFDLSLCSLFLIVFISIFYPNFIRDFSNLTIFLLSLAFYLFVEPIILSIFGNTLGKTLLNIQLKTVDGEPIDFSKGFQRSLFVNAAGMGFGIPVINFICYLFSYKDIKEHGFSTWDRQIGTVLLYGQVSQSRLLLVSLVPIVLLVAGLII